MQFHYVLCLCSYKNIAVLVLSHPFWHELKSKFPINKINQTLIKIGTKFQLDEDKLKKCLNDEKSQDIILKERIEAQKNFNITSTPTIYINDKKYEDKQEFKSFKKQIDKLL